MDIEAMRRRARRLTNLAQQPQASWYRVLRNDAGGPTRVDIYDEIGGSWLFGGVSAVDFVNELAQINGDIEVHINSPGGDVFDGLAIYNSLAQRPGNVTTVVDGLAASAASFIAQAGKVRMIAPGAMMMIHDASGMCMGNAADMRELAELLDKTSDNLAGIYASHAGGEQADWRAAMKATTWYTADEAVEAGLVHKVADRPEQDALAAVARFDLSVYAHVPDGLQNTSSTDGATSGLTEDIRSLIGDEVAAQLRAAVAPKVTAKALPVHHTATVDEPWDGPAAVAAMPNDDTVLEYCFAWQSDEAAATPHKEGDDDADDKKANYKFPHHRTKGGPANLAACRNGLARLEGSSIPEGDKAGVKAHLQAHLDDAGHGDDSKGAQDHAGMPGWLTTDSAPLPAWLTNAEEAMK
ncbi:head maturation protease, ClpP-related [Streptomyces sp. 900105755]